MFLEADPVLNKKALFAILLGFAGWLGYRRYQAGQAEQDLWAEATDRVPPASPH